MLRKSLFTLAGLWLPLGVVAEISSDFSLINDNSHVAGYIDGDKRSASRLLATWDFSAQWQPQWLVAGNLKAFRGRNGEQLTGNREGISNIDAEQFSKIYELYLQYQFDDNSRLKCGQLDANLEFAMVPIGGAFISPPLGITPTAVALPTYYDPALSCSYFYEPADGWQWATGVFAGRSHNNFAEQFYIAEGRYVTENGRASFGYWRHNGDWEHVNTQQLIPASGWYLNYQQQFAPGRYWFFGWSGLNDEVDILHQHRMAGLVFEQIFPQQDVGIVLSQVTALDQADETMLETYWLVHAHEQFQLQPVLQWIDYDEQGKSNSLVVTLRLLLQF